MNTLKLGFAAAVLSALAAVAPAHAGGLFGDGGIIGGSVGDWLDENVEQPILTPVARGAVEAGGAALGAAGAAEVGLDPTLGAALGGAAGRAVNNAFAGGNGSGFSAPAPAPRPVPAPGQIPQFGQPVGFPGPAMAQNYPPVGNVCLTQFGPAFGPLAPLGMPCMAMTPMGPAQGFITR